MSFFFFSLCFILFHQKLDEKGSILVSHNFQAWTATTVVLDNSIFCKLHTCAQTVHVSFFFLSFSYGNRHKTIRNVDWSKAWRRTIRPLPSKFDLFFISLSPEHQCHIPIDAALSFKPRALSSSRIKTETNLPKRRDRCNVVVTWYSVNYLLWEMESSSEYVFEHETRLASTLVAWRNDHENGDKIHRPERLKFWYLL